MIWNSKKKRQCLLCYKRGEHTAEIHYTHAGGADVAYLCQDCADEMQEDRIGEDDEQSI